MPGYLRSKIKYGKFSSHINSNCFKKSKSKSLYLRSTYIPEPQTLHDFVTDKRIETSFSQKCQNNVEFGKLFQVRDISFSEFEQRSFPNMVWANRFILLRGYRPCVPSICSKF